MVEDAIAVHLMRRGQAAHLWTERLTNPIHRPKTLAAGLS
jgi:hypothetical protein